MPAASETRSDGSGSSTGCTRGDGAVSPRMHRDLEQHDLLPAIHPVDTGFFLDAEPLVASKQEYGVELLGPTRRDRRWQSRAAAGFGMADFVVGRDPASQDAMLFLRDPDDACGSRPTAFATSIEGAEEPPNRRHFIPVLSHLNATVSAGWRSP